MTAKKKVLAVFLFLSAMVSCPAQRIRVAEFNALPFDISAKREPVLDRNSEPCALIRIAVASDSVEFSGNIVSGPRREMGEWLLYVPSGTRKLKIHVDGYLPLKYEFSEINRETGRSERVSVKGNRVYEIRVDLLPWQGEASGKPEKSGRKPDSLRTFRVLLAPQFGLPVSCGLMAGFVKKNAGGYLRAKTNFRNASKSYGCDRIGQSGEDGKLWLTGDTRRARWALTAGYIHHLVKPLYLYGGVGYGQSLLLWDCADSRPAEVGRASADGLAAEIGALLRFGRFAATLGVQTTAFKTMELNVGVGLLF